MRQVDEGKVSALTRGDLTGAPSNGGNLVGNGQMSREKSAEAIVPRFILGRAERQQCYISIGKGGTRRNAENRALGRSGLPCEGRGKTPRAPGSAESTARTRKRKYGRMLLCQQVVRGRRADLPQATVRLQVPGNMMWPYTSNSLPSCRCFLLGVP